MQCWITWVKGKENYAPDALSRHLVLDPQPHEQLAEQDKNGNHAVSITELRSTTDNTQESLRMQDLRKHAVCVCVCVVCARMFNFVQVVVCACNSMCACTCSVYVQLCGHVGV